MTDVPPAETSSGFAQLLSHLSPLKRRLLTASLAVGGAGVGLTAVGGGAKTPPPQADAPPAAVAPAVVAPAPRTSVRPGSDLLSGGSGGRLPGGGSGFVSAPGASGSGSPDALTPPPTALPADVPPMAAPAPTPSGSTSLSQAVAAFSGLLMSKVGLSFLGGLVVGILTRVFIKTVLALTAGLIALMAALSYFGVLHVDLTGANHQINTASVWLQDEGRRLGSLLLSKLPSAGTGGVGFFFGFKRH